MAEGSNLDGASEILATLRAGRSALMTLAAAHLDYERLVALHRSADPEGDLLADVHAAIDRRVRAMRARAYLGADATQDASPALPRVTSTVPAVEVVDDEPTPREAATIPAEPVKVAATRVEPAPAPAESQVAQLRPGFSSRLARTIERAEHARSLQGRPTPSPEPGPPGAGAAPAPDAPTFTPTPAEALASAPLPPRAASSLAALGKAAAAAAMAAAADDEPTPIGAETVESVDEELAEIRAAAARAAAVATGASASPTIAPAATGPRAAAAPRLMAATPPAPAEDLGDEDLEEDDAPGGPARIDLARATAGGEAPKSLADADSQAMEEDDDAAAVGAGSGKAVAGGLKVGPSRPERAPSGAPRLTDDADGPDTGVGTDPTPVSLPAADEARVAAIHAEAKAFFDRGELGKSVQAYTDLVEIKHDMVEAFIGRGRCHLELGDYSSAMSDFQRAEDLRPDRPDSHVAMGDLFFARKEYRRAIEHYDEAVELDGSHAMARCRRGISHYYRKNYRQAFQDLQRAYSLDPEIPNIRKYIQMAVKKMERGD